MDAFGRSLVALPRVEAFARERFPEIFGAANVGTVPGSLAVYLTEQPPDIRVEFRTVFRGAIQYFTTGRNELDMRALDAEVSAQKSRLAGLGIELVSWGPNLTTGFERLGVLNLTEPKRHTLRDLFGPWVEIRDVGARPRLAMAGAGTGRPVRPRPARASNPRDGRTWRSPKELDW